MKTWTYLANVILAPKNISIDVLHVVANINHFLNPLAYINGSDSVQSTNTLNTLHEISKQET